MFGSAVLEVAIGILFIYLLVSVICSAVREGIEARVKPRAAYLEHGIRELLHDHTGTGIAAAVYNHPLIYSLYSDGYTPGPDAARPGILARGGELPSYIPASHFALALMDIAVRGPVADPASSGGDAPVVTLASVRAGVDNIGNPAIQRVLLSAIDAAQGDMNRAQANIAGWFNGSMERVSGWYKRSTQWVIFWIALVTCVALNVNTITIADFLYRNESARTALVAQAENVRAAGGADELQYRDARRMLDATGLPLGWSAGWGAPRRPGEPGYGGVWNTVFGPVLGLLLTALAATLGAPFWFDVLNKVMVIRSTVKPYEKSAPEGSEDRQPRDATPPPPAAPLAGGQPASRGAPDAAPAGAAAATPAPPAADAVPPADVTHAGADDDLVAGAPDEDGCSAAGAGATPDEALPPAIGGVAGDEPRR
jgi:hypothetical protein